MAYRMHATQLCFLDLLIFNSSFGTMAPRALASNTIAAFASNADVFALLVSDVLNGDKIDRDTADAVNFVLLRHFGLFTTLQERKNQEDLARS